MLPINSQDRLAREYLTFLNDLLASDQPMEVFHVWKGGGGREDAYWMHTAPHLLEQAGLEFKAGLSFMAWFAMLCDQGLAQFDHEDGDGQHFCFCMGASKGSFESITITDPEWYLKAQDGLGTLVEHIAKTRRERLDVVQARRAVERALVRARAICQQKPVSQFTMKSLEIFKQLVENNIVHIREDIETITERMEMEGRDIRRDLENGRKPSVRSLSNYPDWQRANEQLAAWMDVKEWLDALDQ